MSRSTFVILISIITTMFLWIIFDLYHTYHETFLPIVNLMELENVNPSIDTATVQMLKGK